MAGARVKCPSCRAVIEIPRPNEPESSLVDLLEEVTAAPPAAAMARPAGGPFSSGPARSSAKSTPAWKQGASAGFFKDNVWTIVMLLSGIPWVLFFGPEKHSSDTGPEKKDALGDRQMPDAAKSETPASGPRKVAPDWSKTRTIEHTNESNEWRLTPPTNPTDGPKFQPGIITTPPEVQDEHPSETVLSFSGGHAIVGSAINEKQARQAEEDVFVTRLVLCDVSTRKIIGNLTTPRRFIPLALDEGGTRALMREDTPRMTRKLLEIWNLSPAEITPVVRWLPNHAGADNPGIKWAAFLSNDRLATIDDAKTLVVWNASTAQPLAQLRMGDQCEPALTADRRYLIYGAGREIKVVDLDRLQIVAEKTCEKLMFPNFAISPDGTRFACSSVGNVWIWKLADGSLETNFQVEGQVSNYDLLWPHERFLLFGKSTLVDIESQIPVWSYHGAKSVFRVGQLCAFAVNSFGDDPGAIVLAPIPSPEFETALAKAKEAPDFFILKSGTTVKLNLDKLPDAAERERARASFTERLQANGCQVGQDGTIELVASVEQKPVKLRVQLRGVLPRNAPRESVYDVQEFTSRILFVFNGKSVWGRAAESLPSVVALEIKPGQTVEAAVRETEKPRYGFFQDVRLPAKLMKPMSGLGTSWVKYTGIQ
jgi:hypothetical protein